jgi:streptogramin lyase
VYKVNPNTDSILAEFEGGFEGLAVGYGAVWAFIDDPLARLIRIDPRTNQITDRIPTGEADIYGIDTGYGAVWAANAQLGELLRVETKSRRIVKRILVESTESSPRSVAAGEGSVWVVDTSPPVVSRIDPSTNKVAATISIEGAMAVEAGLGAAWVTTDQGTVVVLNPATNTPLTTIEAGKGSTSGIAIGAGSVWVVNSDEGTVARINPTSYEVEARIPIGENAAPIAADKDQVWVTGKLIKSGSG